MSSKKAAKRGKKRGNKEEAKTAARTVKFVAAVKNGNCSAMDGLLDSGIDIDAMLEVKGKDGKGYATMESVGRPGMCLMSGVAVKTPLPDWCSTMNMWRSSTDTVK